MLFPPTEGVLLTNEDVFFLSFCKLTGCRLKVTNVSVDDAGLYTCEGFNEFGRQLTSGSLIVLHGQSTTINTLGVYGVGTKPT